MTIFQTIAILLTCAAAASYVNNRFLRLPAGTGMMLCALLLSWAAMACTKLGLIDLTGATSFIGSIDFSQLFLHGMLSFLLFAGALHIDLAELKKYRVVVLLLATFGTVIAALVTGSVVWWFAQKLGIPLSYLSALLFGSLIAPTDPVAVLSMVKNSPLSPSLRLKIASESLFNDGVGVVLFLALSGLAAAPQTPLDANHLFTLLAWQGAGSIALGLGLGWATYLMLASIDDYKTEVLLTLALAAGGYCFAESVHVSAPIAMVVAGLVIGNHGRAFVMSEKTRTHLDMFWELLDDILNAVLFILLGLQLMVMDITMAETAIGLAAIIATLAGRLISVAVPIGLMSVTVKFDKGVVGILTWGGLRGGISIAMALSLPPGFYKDVIIDMTYMTVVFSVLFQGTTFNYAVQRLTGNKASFRVKLPWRA